MTAPNRNTLWARIIIDELVACGVESVVFAPGSRSTPLTVAAHRHEGLETDSHLDERSAGFFALGQGKRSGNPTAVITTSGTATANLHPAIIEAHQSRTPLIVLTADRPPELWDSGANQTIDQTDLFGDATRFARTLPEPEPTARKLKSLRTAISRAVGASNGVPPGPVHLNVPFRKPLEPVDVPDDVPEDLEASAPLAVAGRDGPFVAVRRGKIHPTADTMVELESAIETASRGLLVAGPLGPDPSDREALVAIARATGFPILADPLSGVRFGEHVRELTVAGGYDGYIGSAAVEEWPTPEVVLRFGAAPTSKSLRHYLRDASGRQFLVDPAAGWREATFIASDLVQADIQGLASAIETAGLDRDPNRDWHDRITAAESVHWETAENIESDTREAIDRNDLDEWEGGILASVVRNAPDPSTIFVSNSMPVRDLDRFGRPRPGTITALGNRGASGIDGITSTGLGAGSVTDDPLVIVTGDLAYFHDMNGLLALSRFGIEATIVLINNDGGGIFHMLPIEEFEDVFETGFLTPHGLDFGPSGDLYGLEFVRVEGRSAFAEYYTDSLDRSGTQVIEVTTDAASSHRVREQLEAEVTKNLPR